MTRAGRTRLGVAGLLSAAVAGLMAWLAPGTFFPVYLAVLCGVLAAPLGSLAVLMTSVLVRGPWSELLRPGLERGVAALPVASLLFLPVLAGIGVVYPWAEGLPAGTYPFRAAWLSPGVFALRTVLILAILSGVGVLLLRAGSDRARRRLAVAGLALYAILITAILVWAYLHAMQFIVVWMANIPREADWYLRRGEGGWAAAAGLLALGQFALPFLLLLPVPFRRSTFLLKVLALATLLFRPLETAWLVLPAVSGATFGLGLLAAAASGAAMVCLLAAAPPGLLLPSRPPEA